MRRHGFLISWTAPNRLQRPRHPPRPIAPNVRIDGVDHKRPGVADSPRLPVGMQEDAVVCQDDQRLGPALVQQSCVLRLQLQRPGQQPADGRVRRGRHVGKGVHPLQPFDGGVVRGDRGGAEIGRAGELLQRAKFRRDLVRLLWLLDLQEGFEI